MTEPDNQPPREAGGRRAVVVALLVLASVFAGGVVLIGRLGGGGSAQQAPPTGPALQLGGLAGNYTVGLTARANSVEVNALAPISNLFTPAQPYSGAVALRVSAPSGVAVTPPVHACGAGCHFASIRLARGLNVVGISLRPGETPVARVRFVVPWPLGPSRVALLRQVVRTTESLRSLTIEERSTSDPARGLFPSPTLHVAGRGLEDGLPYAIQGAVDVRELPSGVRGLRLIAYAVPTSNLWYELWFGADDVIDHQRVVTPNHLIFDRFFDARF